jgi:nucleotide-binding universal stress UspA family protein
MTAKKKNTILIPIDFSPIANYALTHAIQVAKYFDNNLALLYVIEEGFLNSLFGYGEEKQEETKKNVRAQLNAIAEQVISEHNIDCQTILKVGKIYQEIAQTANELGCDSIIMGSHGASGFEQIVGSNASKTIMHADVPVIVVKSDKNVNAYRNIVFPLDLTIESRQKVNWAIHLGKAYGSTIHLLSYKVGDENINISLRASLKQVTKLLEQNNVSYTEHVLEELSTDFALETLSYSEKIDADIILIMSQHESGGITDFVIGTDAQQIVNKSQKIPIMCIKPKPLGYASDFVI